MVQVSKKLVSHLNGFSQLFVIVNTVSVWELLDPLHVATENR